MRGFLLQNEKSDGEIQVIADDVEDQLYYPFFQKELNRKHRETSIFLRKAYSQAGKIVKKYSKIRCDLDQLKFNFFMEENDDDW